VRRFLAVVIAVLGLAFVAAPAASAHATVVSSNPPDGARLASAPTTVSVTFDEAVGLNGVGYLRVVDQSGRTVDAGTASHPGGDATQISVALQPGLGPGTYTASFRVISADSHPLAGAIRFVVGSGALVAGPPGTPSTTNGATGFLFDVVRWVTFAGLVLLGGGWLLAGPWAAGRDDRRARELLWTGWVTASAGAVAEVVVQGPYSAGRGPGALGDASLLDATLHSTFGTAHSVRLLLLGLLGVTLAALLRGRWRPELAQIVGALGLGVAVTYAISGHATGENPRWLATASDTVHLTAMSIWLGGLVYLLVTVLPRRDPDELGAVLPAFSRVAFGCVAALAVTGSYQAWLGVGSLDAFTSTRYGQLVLVKIGLFLVLLMLGNLSRIAVQRRYIQPVAYAMTDAVLIDHPADTDAPVRLRRAVLAEVALGVAVLAVTAVLVAQPPGRAAAADTAAKSQTSRIQLGAGRTATLNVAPGRHGPVSVSLSLSPGAKPVGVTLKAALPAKQLGPIDIPLTSGGGLTYAASSILLPSPGAWTFTLNLRTSEFDAVTADTTIHLS
jgi:copper transport protein